MAEPNLAKQTEKGSPPKRFVLMPCFVSVQRHLSVSKDFSLSRRYQAKLQDPQDQQMLRWPDRTLMKVGPDFQHIQQATDETGKELWNLTTHEDEKSTSETAPMASHFALLPWNSLEHREAAAVRRRRRAPKER